MCFYDQYEFLCKDFRWGNFRQHCTKEFRRGETCGMKLVNDVIEKKELCSVCDKLQRKIRRYQGYEEKLKKWEAEGRSRELRATVQKTREDQAAVRLEIEKLMQERVDRGKQIGGNRRTPAQAAYPAAAYQQASVGYSHEDPYAAYNAYAGYSGYAGQAGYPAYAQYQDGYHQSG